MDTRVKPAHDDIKECKTPQGLFLVASEFSGTAMGKREKLAPDTGATVFISGGASRPATELRSPPARERRECLST